MAFARGRGMEAEGLRKKYTVLLSITSLVIFGNRKKSQRWELPRKGWKSGSGKHIPHDPVCPHVERV